MAATEATPRVALLARAGEACERITDALREAGADVVLVADPLQADPEQVRHATPQAILVALDPAIEDAIDRYADVLADPDYMVIFEEAEQAAQRTGWDAARWLRHLSAKLHRHNDVLPAGAEVDDSLLPTPGPLASTAVKVDFEEAIVAFTDEAQQHAGEVPRDSGVDGLTGLALADLEPQADTPAETGSDSPAQPAQAPAWNLDGDESDPALTPATGDEVEAVVVEAEPETDPASFVLPPVDGDVEDELSPDEMSFDVERFNRAGQAGESTAGIEDFLAAQLRQEPPADLVDDAPEAVQAVPVEAEAVPRVDFSGLSLIDDDAAPAVVAATPGTASTPPAFDLDGLGSGLSLAEPDSYGHGPTRGAVVIEAGLGGPDAVRQLLAAIPEGFARPILIRLALEGGRYDRLVKQMTRATAAPVNVAEDGQTAQAGSIYFVPPELGIRQRGGWVFDASLGFDPASLPPRDSAVLFLSGADAARVAAVSGAGWDGGLVLGQTPDEGCYDPAAAQAAIAAGADHGTPVALAARLLARWPTGDAAPDPDSSGMLQP